MFEETPKPIDAPERLTIIQQKTLVTSLRALIGWMKDDTLGGQLTRLSVLFEQYFGAQSTQPWANSAQRAVVLISFVCSVDKEIYKAAQAQRSVEPLVDPFFEKLEEALRRAIPLAGAQARAKLFGSCYPLGSGANSLAALCIDSEFNQKGTEGLVAFLAQDSRTDISTYSRTEDLLRAVNTELSRLDSKSVKAYANGLVRVFFEASPCAIRFTKLFLGLSRTVPLKTLVGLYCTIQGHEDANRELKQVLFSEILDAIGNLTGELFTKELRALRNVDAFPSLTVEAARPIENIAACRRRQHAVAQPDFEKARKLLTASQITTKPFEHASPSEGGARESASPGGHIETPGASEHAPQDMGLLSWKEMAKKFKELSHVDLAKYVTETVNAKMIASDSKPQENFSLILEGLGLQRLLIIRKALTSQEKAFEDLRKSVAGRIKETLFVAADKSSAKNLVGIYCICAKAGSGVDELGIIKAGLRKSLELSEREDQFVEHELSLAGQRVWKWLFSDMPRDRSLLNEYFRRGLDRIMSEAARDLSTETGAGSVIDAVLDYAKELRFFDSYTPGPHLTGVGIWKLINFTVAVSKELVENHLLVRALKSSISEQLLAEEVKPEDAFPLRWRDAGRTQEISSLCSRMERDITGKIQDLDLERSNTLVINLNLLALRGPESFNKLLFQARPRFMYHVWRIDEERLSILPEETLVRVVQGLRACRHRNLALLGRLSQECASRAEKLSSRQFTSVAESFADLGAGDGTFWDSFASFAERNWSSFLEEKLLSTLWSLAVMAPHRVPTSFDTSFLPPRREYSFNPARVTQTLIALGRYKPARKDYAYQQIAAINIPHQMSKAEKGLLEILPLLLSVPKSAIVPQVNIGGFETDFVVNFGNRRLIIELDGSTHFLLGRDGGCIHGRDKFQDMVFKNLGYEVFHLPMSALREVDSSQKALAELKEVALNLKGEGADAGAKHPAYLEDLKEAQALFYGQVK